MRKRANNRAGFHPIATLKNIISEPVPPAVAGKIQPLIMIGCIVMVIAIVTLFFKPIRRAALLFVLLGIAILGYALLQKAAVIRHGYREIWFKVVDYTYLTRLNRRPTGMLLIKDEAADEESELYHIAVSGEEDLPPIGWIIKAYVPADAEPAEYNGRKFFSTVYGYKLEGEARN